MTCLPWTPLATGAVKRNVSSELVVGSDGLSASEPRRGAIGAEGAVELVLRVAEPGAVAPDRFEPAPRPAPPQPASTTAASSAAVPGAGPGIRARQASAAIAVQRSPRMAVQRCARMAVQRGHRGLFGVDVRRSRDVATTRSPPPPA